MQTVRNRILLAKVETVYGTDSVPTVASNAIEAKNIKLSWNGSLLERDNVRNNISPVSPIVGKRWVEVTFDVELKGSGTKGTAGVLGALLQACSMAETASAGSSVIYVPTSSSQKSITMYVYDIDSAGSAVLSKITGAVGSFTLKVSAGEYASLSMSFKGLYTAPSDVALPSNPTYETTTPPVVESATFTLNSSSNLIVQELSVELGNNIAERDDINTANAIKAFVITSRKPKGKFNPEALTVAGYGFWADWTGASQRALSLVVGSAAGNKCTITAPKVTLDSIADGDRENLLVRDIPFSLGQNAGNDELQFKFE